ncbi:FBF1 factor, partial [Callaeas wilsoni]|nr:FBF1 factor [Callaeas wilsoni]
SLEKPFPAEEPAGPGSSSGSRAGPSAPAPPRPDVTFGDAVDDLVDALGLGNGAAGAGNALGQGLRKGRAGIRELLGGGAAGEAPEQPGKAELGPDPRDREQPGPRGLWDEPGFPFGSYEPSVASGSGRRRGRRFPAGSSSQRSSGAAWLGLKDEEFPG